MHWVYFAVGIVIGIIVATIFWKWAIDSFAHDRCIGRLYKIGDSLCLELDSADKIDIVANEKTAIVKCVNSDEMYRKEIENEN